MIKTDICDLLQIEYPIFQGGMAWLGTAELASAVSEAGGLGIIGAGHMPPDIFRNEIRKVKERTNKPFGCNIMLMSPFVKEVMEVVVEERVPVITTGAGNPGVYIPALKEIGTKVIPVVASVLLAKRLLRGGIDAIIAEGTESGGHVGDITTMALLPQVVDAVDVPVIAAGGIADGRGVAAAFALGAHAVQMGTRFVLSEECIAHENYKNAVLKAKDRSTVMTGLTTGHPVRIIDNQLAHKYKNLEFKVGMLQDLYNAYPIVKQRFEEADEALGYSISKLCFEGPDTELVKTANTQPAILTASVACYEVLKEQGFTPDIVGGHSLGEYSALVAAGVLDFKDAVYVVHKRGEYMQEAVPLGKGAMAAILALPREQVVEICQQVNDTVGSVQAVNFNCPGQIVIAGETAAVETAAEKMKEAGAKRAVMLPVSAPFHSRLMEPAALRLKEELDKIQVNDAKIPVVANVTGKILTNASDIKESLVTQAANPVLWEDCVAEMVNFGVTRFVEVGPGKVLTGFTKKINKEMELANVEDIPSLEKTLEFLKGVR